MKKIYKRNQTIEVTTPNNVKIEATVIRRVAHEITRYNDVDYACDTYLCYAQNRLFTYIVEEDHGIVEESYGELVCEYCIIPKDEPKQQLWTTSSTID